MVIRKNTFLYHLFLYFFIPILPILQKRWKIESFEENSGDGGLLKKEYVIMKTARKVLDLGSKTAVVIKVPIG